MRYHNLAVIFQVTSVLPFSAKNVLLAAYLLESSLARFKTAVCCFQIISCLLSFTERETNGSPQKLVYFLPYEREQEVHKCIHPKHFQVSGIKTEGLRAKRAYIKFWPIFKTSQSAKN